MTIASLFLHTLFIAEISLLIIVKLLVPDIVDIATSGISSLFYPNTHSSEAKPHYSAARTAKNRGEYKRALKLYTEISQSFPSEVEPYVAMITIMRSCFHNEKEAEMLFQKGLSHLSTPETKEYLNRFYYNS